jgi:hypothetical protein
VVFAWLRVMVTDAVGAMSPPVCQLKTTLRSPVAALTASDGTVVSYANGVLATLTALPALSTQVPKTVALRLEGPAYVVDVHDTMPENEDALTAAGTGWLYQPPESGGREGAAVAVGEEVSTWSV